MKCILILVLPSLTTFGVSLPQMLPFHLDFGQCSEVLLPESGGTALTTTCTSSMNSS
jgi:hypothetical protein